MNSIRSKILGTSLAIGLMSHSVSAQQDWSRFTPPPVKVADLPQATSSPDQIPTPNQAMSRARTSSPGPERSVLQASHLETGNPPLAVLDAVGWSEGSYGIPGPPPHRVIQAPVPPPPSNRHGGNRHGHFSGSPLPPIPTNDSFATVDELPRSGSGHQGPPLHTPPHHTPPHPGLSHHGPILPELPGVENDPKSAGPGHLGLGTHWIRERPSMHPPIPGATVEPRWKAPYSYGHFGAEGKRSWTRQYGYRDRYLQWSLR